MDFFEQAGRFDIILGSQSPRRKALLADTGLPFRSLVRQIPESFPAGLTPNEVAGFLCREKSVPFQSELKNPSVILITADTIVVNRGKILNKPGDSGEAFGMLRALSGRWHKVMTGVCICHDGQKMVFVETTGVCFRELSDWEISHYIDTCSPYDKAGAYGIQEWIGQVGIRQIRGSWSNVVGLPVERVFSALKEIVEASPGRLRR
jgi:septum formation protein